MLTKCNTCKHSDIVTDKEKYKIKMIFCKRINHEIPLKKYNKMGFCMYHEPKESSL